MLCVAAGDVHGRLERLYEDVLAFERELGRAFAHVLQVGDFGVWPDPTRVDRATRDHDGAGDFPTWFAEQRGAPRPTTFIQGNHEDFGWLKSRREVLPSVHFLPNGEALTIHDAARSHGRPLRIAGVGGCYGPASYRRAPETLHGGARRHYVYDELEQLRALGPLDVVLFHDAPRGIEFIKRMASGDERRYTSQAEGLNEALAAIRPKLCFFGHHHMRIDAEIEGVPCVGLNAVGYRGSLVAFETGEEGSVKLLDQWP